MPSADRKLELQAKDIDVSTVWQLAVCSNGLIIKQQIKSLSDTSIFIKYAWLHVLTLRGSSSGFLVEPSH